MHVVRPAPAEWRTGGITTTGVTPQQGSKEEKTTKDGRKYIYEPKANELRAFRKQVRELVQAKYPGLTRLEPILTRGAPVAIRILLRMPIRQSDPPPDRVDAVTGGYPLVWFSVAPDLDKMVRAVFDALTGAHVWHDDAQACWLSAAAVRHPRVGAVIEWRPLT